MATAFRREGREEGTSLSVVVPVWNGASDLEHMLAALTPQLLEGDDCTVVDDGSTEDIGAVAARFGVKTLRLERQRGPAVARNEGAKASPGEILMFLDADVTPHAETLHLVRSHFRSDAGLAAVMGSYDRNPLSSHTISRFRNLLHCYAHQTGQREASTFWSGCGAVRRTAFESVGGFNGGAFSEPSVEDVELGYRLRRANFRILLDPSIQVQHRKRWTLGSMVATDVFRRAAPMTQLLFESGHLPNDLSFSRTQRLSVVCVLLAVMCTPAVAWQPGAAVAAMALLLACAGVMNLGLYRFLRECGGTWFAVRCLPLHWLYYVSAAAGAAIGGFRWTVNGRGARG